MFNPSTINARQPFVMFLAFLVPFTVLNIWVYNGTVGSVLMVMLLHALVNISSPIQAARAGATEHFILVSIQGVAPDHPMELSGMKYLAEQELKASGLAWSIIRPTAYIETSFYDVGLIVSG
jgi:uncharacterized protein YbjT (DUF2867 family)